MWTSLKVPSSCGPIYACFTTVTTARILWAIHLATTRLLVLSAVYLACFANFSLSPLYKSCARKVSIQALELIRPKISTNEHASFWVSLGRRRVRLPSYRVQVCVAPYFLYRFYPLGLPVSCHRLLACNIMNMPILLMLALLRPSRTHEQAQTARKLARFTGQAENLPSRAIYLQL